MKISKKVWIDPKVKWNILRARILCKQHCYKGHAYFVCTSPQEHLLFEIIEAQWLSDWYKNESVLAVCQTRLQAFEAVKRLVDALYNTQTITYAELLK